MAEKRRGLGRGLGALIPNAPSGDARPVDVFFPGSTAVPAQQESPATEEPGQDGRDVASTDDARQPAPASSSAEPASSEPAASGDAGPGAPDEKQVGSDAVELVPVPGAHFAELPVDAIQPNPRQPRTVFDEEALAELVGSIREIGVLQPVVVRKVPGSGDEPAYELIMGERRWRATQEAGLARIPAIVRDTDDADLLRDALLENLHRSQLNPLEEAAAYQQLLDDFDCTHEDLARRIHRSRPQISNTLRLLRLPPLVQRRVAAGVLSAGHARALLGLPDAAAMERLAQRIVAEGLSVRATEEIVTLGGEPERPTPARRPRPGDRNAALDDLASRLSDRFDTRVKIALGKSKGRLTVEFASVQDLNRILEVISPEDPGLLR
ncbi:ParB/RepB/Spo0J family partition protein [Cellulomonas sp. APG4]|uniref:ParB/RepB/Spo0J family partition protein n=1 Tax=Cellulomonas sp. APG4 TaxID=1538656 RepID=UPI00137A41C8|nr:ParB/RepB/Spo0J family partition protein [Cellulomonas sp. APG4]NCT91474.1 ParB/RepB/Spo0J family partition protein [Cellulomonas sp. APG4]